ncbi:MAG: DUF3108 domain-containing protein [Betaproteobacteria bacterium]|nr:DUF3108 domain-containing protein [Betaproteobacteria bacterium]
MTPRVLSLRLLAALFVSLLLHAAMISGTWLRVSEMTAAQPPLEARLASPPAPIPAPPAVKPAPRPRAAARRTVSPRPTVPPVATAAAPLAFPPEPEPPEAADETAEIPAPEAVSPPIAEVPPVPQTPAPAPLKSLPKKGRIAYTMYFGVDGFTVGKTVQSWEVGAGGYKLGSVSETTGIVELFRSQRHIYLSEGKLTARGLQPEKFFMSRTRRGQTEAAQARFDWEAGTITLGRVPAQRGAPLSADTQDIVSFMYHLALSPPAVGRIRLPITNGSRFETFDLDVLDEEQIETPLGMLKTLPVKQVPRPGAESVEIWLAIEYRYLPVKIRFFDREGNPMGEQIVNEIRISDE